MPGKFMNTLLKDRTLTGEGPDTDNPPTPGKPPEIAADIKSREAKPKPYAGASRLGRKPSGVNVVTTPKLSGRRN